MTDEELYKATIDALSQTKQLMDEMKVIMKNMEDRLSIINHQEKISQN